MLFVKGVLGVLAVSVFLAGCVEVYQPPVKHERSSGYHESGDYHDSGRKEHERRHD
ncbi:MAG: hypothetical protein HQM07_02295 [Zetaproteobacteria bacterium]|nr:hypothetical protein [Zetaproteobacteria bacterium]